MKVVITFELDLADTPYNISNPSLIPVCLQNLGSWVGGLHRHYLERRLSSIENVTNAATRQALLKAQAHDAELASQIFNNYRVSGVTENGSTFEFTHTEPGYREKLTVNGADQRV